MSLANSDRTTSAETSLRDRGEIVARLRDSQLFRDYVRAFQALTGLPLTLRAAGSFQPPMAGSAQVNPLCALLAARNKSCAACLQLQEKIERSACERASTMQCFAGLFESAVPVRLGDQPIAYLQTGQVLFDQPNTDQFRRGYREVAGNDPREDELAHAYNASRVMGRAQYDSMLRLLEIFGQHLSALTNQLMLQQSHAELPAITRAKGYIAENIGEEIHLSDVARTVGMSTYYFCKTFRRVTGLTFTEYVARARVEAVKKILVNPHKRISEGAFEAGFQSLSQFNRVFQRVAGMSPTAFREQLHGNQGEVAPGARRGQLVFAA